jgi:mono/diheme cytochrome c family protein
MNRAFVVALAAVALAAGAASAEDSQPTFYKDVLPIVQENCQVCHRPGGANLGGMVAPMAFVTYEESRPWAKAMAKMVAERAMPPWHASPAQHGLFENERTLSDEQIATIVRWAESGAARGAPTDAPAVKEWPDFEGWMIGEPDLVLTMPEKYFVEDDVEDIYVDFNQTITKEMLPNDRWIKAIEFRPGSPVVHHIIAFPLGGIAPGNGPTLYPDGVSRKLSPGENIRWQMHYHKEPGPGTGQWDQSQMALVFYPEGAEIKYQMQGNHLGRFDFAIPAGDPNYTIQADYTFKHDSQIVQLMPHMHVRGKSAKYEAFYPDGTSEVLLDVPRYDFNWQTAYQYEQFKKVPAGTKVVFTSSWDNSADNPYNPDPAKTIRWGEPTTDEMSFGYMSFINDSGEYEGMFGGGRDDDDERGGGGPSLTQVISMFDKNGDGLLQKDEAPGQMANFFDMIDQNKDGAVDLQEAEAAQKFREQQQKQQPSL